MFEAGDGFVVGGAFVEGLAEEGVDGAVLGDGFVGFGVGAALVFADFEEEFDFGVFGEERAELVTNAQVNMSLRDQKALDAGGDWMENSSWFTLSICTDAVHCMDWIEQHTGERPVLLREVFGEDARYYDVGSGVG